MFKKEIKLLRIGGILITLDSSWFWIFLLVATSFYLSTQPLNLSRLLHISLALFGAILFFSSVLLHELSHTFVANKYGLPVNKITLFLFGGVSNLTTEPKKPKTELLMALAGPAASLVIGFVFLGLYYIVRDSQPLVWLFVNLSYLNFLLAIFNIMPAYPLDGGRVFRSYIWAKTGNLDKATELASLVGRMFAILLIVWGIIQFIFLGVLSGLWLVFIGLFLYRMAAISPLESRLLRKIEKIKVEDVKREYPELNPNNDIKSLIEYAEKNYFDYIIIRKQDNIAGVLPAVDYINEDNYPGDELIEIDAIPDINADDTLLSALQLMQSLDTPLLQIKKNGVFFGIITMGDIARIMR